MSKDKKIRGKKGYMFKVNADSISLTTCEDDFKNTWNVFETLGEAKRFALERCNPVGGGSRIDMNYMLRNTTMEELWNDYNCWNKEYLVDEINELSAEIEKLTKKINTLKSLDSKYRIW